MNIEIIANQFETRAGTLLRYYTGLLENSRETPFGFKIYNDPFDMVYVVMNGNLYGHIYIKDCNVRKAFELASPKHTEGLIRSIDGYYAGYELHDDKTLSISDMMADNLFNDEFLCMGYKLTQNLIIVMCSTIWKKAFDSDTVEGIQSSNADVIGNIEMLYQLATGINEPATELVED